MRKLAASAALILMAARLGAAAENPADILPRAQEVLGWSVSRDAATCEKAGLDNWQGENAALIADYRFVSGADAVYAGPGDASVTVEVFELESAADAAGLLWCLAAGVDAEKAEIGQDAWVSGALGAVWRDSYCARVKSGGEAAGAALIKDFLGVIARRIGKDGFLPDIFRAIDTIGYIEGSARFMRTNRALAKLHFVSEENVLQLSQDTEMVTGKFVIDDRMFEAFIIRYPSERAAVDGAASYAAFLGNDPDHEAAWFKQWGRVIAGTWTDLAVPETVDSEYMLFNTIKDLMREVRIFQLQK